MMIKEIPDIILDTDFGADCDDCIALGMLINLAKQGKVKFDTLTLCTTREFAPNSVQAIFNYYGYQASIGQMSLPGLKVDDVDHYNHAFKDVQAKQNVEDAVTLLRKKLQQSRLKVQIVGIGPLTNIARLLMSKPDDISSLNGLELVKEKVSSITIMGCSFSENNLEWNTTSDIESSMIVYSKCPVPICVAPSELGSQVKSGMSLFIDQENPIEKMIQLFAKDFGAKDLSTFERDSWDELTLLGALKDPRLVIERRGFISIDTEGKSILKDSEDGSHSVFGFKEETSKSELHEYINQLVCARKETKPMKDQEKVVMNKKQFEAMKRKDAKIRAILFPSDIDKGENQGNYIVLKNINKIYDNDVQAVFDFNLKIKKQEFIVFVGPSGCGKSTTLRMIAGLEDITSGDLLINGVYTNELAPKNRNIAMVFQSYALYPHMTVFNNLAFGIKIRKFPTVLLDKEEKPVKWIDKNRIKSLEEQMDNCIKIQTLCDKEIEKLSQVNDDQDAIDVANEKIGFYKNQIQLAKRKYDELTKELESAKTTEVEKMVMRHLPKEEINARVMEAAKILEITEYLTRKPKALSGGQRQRVALGRAIVRNASAFLMDEPLSNLDAKLRVQMRSEIVQLHKRIGATTIYVTHDQTEAMTMADRIVVMKDGMVQQIGTPVDIYSHPRNLFVAQFIGAPAMNVFKGKYLSNKFVVGTELEQELPSTKDVVSKYYRDEIERLNNVVTDLDKLIKDKKHVRHEVFVSAKEEALILINEYKEKSTSEGFDVLFGIRPEDITLGDKKAKNSIEAKAELVELLGSEYFVHVNLCGEKMIVKTGNDRPIKAGDTIYLNFKNNKIHLFDAKTKMSIL